MSKSRSPGRHGTVRIAREGEGGRLVDSTKAEPEAEHNGRDGGRREAATGTARGRRGKVPMGAQVSRQTQS